MHQSNVSGRHFLLRVSRPDQIHLRLAVPSNLNLADPIDREHDLPVLNHHGAAIADQQAMRDGIIPTEGQLLDGLRQQHPLEEVLAYVGNGNLLANYGFAAYAGGQLLRLAQEPIFQKSYTVIASRKNGLVSVDDVWFGQEFGRTLILAKAEGGIEEITDQIDFVSSGQPLVRHGRRIPIGQETEMFYDTRHLLRPIRVPVNGVNLFLPNSQFQHGLLRKAVAGSVRVALAASVDGQISLPLSTKGWLRMADKDHCAVEKAAQFLKQHAVLETGADISDSRTLLKAAEITEQMLQKGLDEAGYEIVDTLRPLREGEASFVNDHLEVFFKKALYPHNVFVRWDDGSYGFVVFPGRSGREGTTLPEAQRTLVHELKVSDGVLLDNGGDVRLWYRGRHLVPSSEGRAEIRSILALSIAAGAPVGAVTIY